MTRLILVVAILALAWCTGHVHVAAALAMVLPLADETIGRLYSVAELMKWSGEAEATWRKRIQRREIEIVKCGANTRVTESALREWVARRTRPAKGQS